MQIIYLEQQSDQWHAKRKLSIGSSDASVIMGCDPYRKYDELLLEKTGKFQKSFVTNPAIELGKKWEGAAREYFNFINGLFVEPAVGSHDSFSFLIASFDGLSESDKTLIEIKYVGEAKLLEYLKNGPPRHHWIQMQHQLMVSGYDSMWYVPYNLSDGRKISRIEFIRVELDNSFVQNELLVKELEFYEKMSGGRGL